MASAGFFLFVFVLCKNVRQCRLHLEKTNHPSDREEPAGAVGSLPLTTRAGDTPRVRGVQRGAPSAQDTPSPALPSAVTHWKCRGESGRDPRPRRLVLPRTGERPSWGLWTFPGQKHPLHPTPWPSGLTNSYGFSPQKMLRVPHSDCTPWLPWASSASADPTYGSLHP